MIVTVWESRLCAPGPVLNIRPAALHPTHNPGLLKLWECMPHRLAAQPKPRGKLMLRLQPVSTGKLPGCYLILNPFCDLLILRCSSHASLCFLNTVFQVVLIRCMFKNQYLKITCFFRFKACNFTSGFLCNSYSLYFKLDRLQAYYMIWMARCQVRCAYIFSFVSNLYFKVVRKYFIPFFSVHCTSLDRVFF